MINKNLFDTDKGFRTAWCSKSHFQHLRYPESGIFHLLGIGRYFFPFRGQLIIWRCRAPKLRVSGEYIKGWTARRAHDNSRTGQKLLKLSASPVTNCGLLIRQHWAACRVSEARARPYSTVTVPARLSCHANGSQFSKTFQTASVLIARIIVRWYVRPKLCRFKGI